MKNTLTVSSSFIDIYTFVNGMHNYRVKVGVTKDLLHTLFFIKYSEKEVTPKLLTTYFNVSKPRITKLITPLIEKNYIISKPSQTDRRSYCLTITSDGDLFLQHAMEELEHLHKSLVQSLGEDEYQKFIQLIKKANHIFE